jgi:hypothetical protein
MLMIDHVAEASADGAHGSSTRGPPLRRSLTFDWDDLDVAASTIQRRAHRRVGLRGGLSTWVKEVSRRQTKQARSAWRRERADGILLKRDMLLSDALSYLDEASAALRAIDAARGDAAEQGGAPPPHHTAYGADRPSAPASGEHAVRLQILSIRADVLASSVTRHSAIDAPAHDAPPPHR